MAPIAAHEEHVTPYVPKHIDEGAGCALQPHVEPQRRDQIADRNPIRASPRGVGADREPDEWHHDEARHVHERPDVRRPLGGADHRCGKVSSIELAFIARRPCGRVDAVDGERRLVDRDLLDGGEDCCRVKSDERPRAQAKDEARAGLAQESVEVFRLSCQTVRGTERTALSAAAPIGHVNSKRRGERIRQLREVLRRLQPAVD